MKKRREKKIHLSFTKKVLILVFCCILIPLSITVAISFHAYRTMVLTEVKAFSKQEVDSICEKIENYFSALNMSLITYNNMEIKEAPVKVGNNSAAEGDYRAGLKQLCRVHDISNAYLCLDKTQTVYYAYAEESKVDYGTFQDNLLLEYARKTFGYHITHTGDNAEQILLLHPMRDYTSQEFEGFLAAKIPKKYFRQQITAGSYNYGGLCFIAKDGMVIYSTGTGLEEKKFNESSFSWEGEFLENEESYAYKRDIVYIELSAGELSGEYSSAGSCGKI